MRRLLLFLLLLAATMLGTVWGATHPRIGLVLSGGGARGAAHVGVLKVLEEMRIPITAIAGTSMGALVGGAYASGVSVEVMERRLTSVDWNGLFVDDPPREQWPMRRKDDNRRPTWDFRVGVRDGEVRLPKGALAGQRVELFFADLVQGAELIHQFDDLPIPFRAIATDLEDGSLGVFDSGSLPRVMRASMSVPGAFAPIEIDGRLYVDGGLVRNLPLDVVRAMGVDLVIAVNLGSTYLPRKSLETVIGVMGQMVAILTEQNVKRSLAQIDARKDVLITPDLDGISSTDFPRAAEAIAKGELAARDAAPRLARLSVSPAEYASWRNARPAPSTAVKQVDEVEISGTERVNVALFQPLIANQKGQPLDRARLESDIQGLYGRGDFEHIRYRIDRRDGKTIVIVDAVEKSLGPGYLSFGLGLRSDFQGDNRFGIRGTYRRTWFNRLGAEWLTSVQIGNELEIFSEFYQPLRLDRRGFVAPYVSYTSDPLSVFRDNKRVARYDVNRFRFGLDIGSSLLEEKAEVRIGAFYGTTGTSLDTGQRSFPETNTNESGLRATFQYDTLDNLFFPRAGSRLALDIFAPQTTMGADRGYQRLLGAWTGAYSRGDDTLVGKLRLGTSLDSDLPYYDQFALGGFHQLSGYASEQFRGNRMAFGGLIYYRKLMALKPPLGKGVYLGGSLEVGAVQDTVEALTEEKTRYGGSLFLGADTWLGPAYLGIGVTAEGDTTGYVGLGRR